MFSINVKNEIMQNNKALESSLNNKSINNMIPEVIHIKMKDNSKSNSQEAHKQEKESHRLNIIFPNHKKKHSYNKKEHIYKTNFKLSLINENSNISGNNYNKNIKMIYEIKKLPNISNKYIKKNSYDMQEEKGKLSIIPKVNLKTKPKKSNKLSKINNIISLNFFTPKLTKIKLKNRNNDRYINLMDLPLKDFDKNKIMEREIIKLALKEKKNENIKKDIIIKEAAKKQYSVNREKFTIKILKANKTNELIMSRNINYDDNIMNYSYYNSPIHSIKSRYNNTYIINDN